MKQPNILVYGSMSCPDTVKTREFLDKQEIPYEFKDVDADPSYNDYIADLNGGKRVMPTLRIDNETVVNPSESDLKAAVEKAVAAR